MVTHLDDQHASRVQMIRRFTQNPAHEVQPVGSAGEGECGFGAILSRQTPHRGCAYVRRIGNDQIVAPIRQRGEQIRLEQSNPALEAVLAHVAARDFERIA
jgi:hypothetical protein